MIAIVETFLNGLVDGELDDLPLHPEVTAESPLFPRASGRAVIDYNRVLSVAIEGIDYIQHIVEGTEVASMFVEQTKSGPLTVFSRFHIEDGLIKDVRVFYDPRQLSST